MSTLPPPPISDLGYESSSQILGTIFEEMSTKCGFDDEGNELRYPANLHEIEIVKQGLARLDAIGCTDPGILEQKQVWQRIADTAARRKFHGSWKMVVIAFLAVLIMSWGRHPFSANTLPDETAAQTALQKQIDLTKTELRARQDLLRSAPAAQKQKEQGFVDESRKELDRLKSLSPTQYLSEYNDQARAGQRASLKTFLGWMLIPVLYFLSGLTPYYLVMRRRSLIEKWRVAWGFAGKILFAIVGAFMAVEATEYVVHWSDGSKTHESDAGGVLLMKAFVLVAVLGIFLVLVFYVLPILTLCNFIANYTPGWLEKLMPKKPLPAF